VAFRGFAVELGDTQHGNGVHIGPIDLEIGEGECVCVVGPSGAGKTTIGQALLGMLAPGGRHTGGSVEVDGVSLFDVDQATLRSVRGRRVSMIFQDPGAALNPVRRLDRIFADVLSAHGTTSRVEIEQRSRAALTAAQLNPDAVLRSYPHELSGGMCQRAMVALALVNQPAVVVADEPTTALDPTTQKEVLELFATVRRTTTLVVITHDLRVARRLADRVVVLSRGQIVDSGPVQQIMTRPNHPVTQALVANQKLTRLNPRTSGAKE